jgi:predicted metalloprotease
MPQVPPPSGAPPSSATSGRDAFLTAVFHDAEAMWRREFAAAGLPYRPPRLTIFEAEVETACGVQSASVGPFYCPADAGVYLDTTFFAALSLKAGVRLGDFAQAYVVAHEVGHHVQILLGITQQVAAADERDPRGRNARSVRVELQADCFAGIWAHSAYRRGALTAADFEDALAAAAVIGDDFLQHRTTGTITPHDWTHGSSAQRQHWLTTGFVEGRPAACDTFR